jgi:hypothetical protein
MREPQFYDAETISMLKSAYDETCAAVPAERLNQAMRASIAERILKIAGTGERDRVRLRTRALMEVASNTQDKKGQGSAAMERKVSGGS